MGYIPIIFFTLAAIFLWVMTVASAIKNRKQKIATLKGRLQSVNSEIGNIVTNLFPDQNLTDKIKRAISAGLSSEKPNDSIKGFEDQKFVELLSNIKKQIDQHGDKPEIKKLVDYVKQKKILKRELSTAIFNYNRITEKPPTHYIAKMLKQPPIHSAA